MSSTFIRVSFFIVLLSCVRSEAQTYFYMDKQYPCSWGNYHPSVALSDLTPCDPTTLKRAFDSISHQSGIEFNYPQGGCQQRAEIMSLMLSGNYHIDHARIWLFAPQDLEFNRDERLYIADPNSWSPNNTIEWGYHVAPVVLVRLPEKLDTLVIDPSIDRDKPLRLKEWFGKIGNSSISKYTFLQKDKYFFNRQYLKDGSGTLSNVIDGCFYEFVGAGKDNLVMERGLAVNDLAVIILNKYIRPMEKQQGVNPRDISDLKAVFGNATVMDDIFAQNISGATPSTTVRYLFTKYDAIMVDARDIFNKRLAYWTKVSNQLMAQ